MSIKNFGVSALVATFAFVAFAPSAFAANQDGAGNNNEFVFYYNSNTAGSLSDFTTARSDLAGYAFLSTGNGQGTAVKNNSASARNLKSSSARVYYNSNYGGPYDTVAGETSKNLVNTYNDNASFKWI